MPDLQEVFHMATQKVHPEPGFARRQQDHQRRRRRNRKVGAFAVTASILAVAVAVFIDTRGGPTTTPADHPTTPAAQSPSTAADVISRVATGGFSPKLSPDGTTIAFLRDPYRRHIKDAAPYVLQVWLVDADGSGLRKVWQRRGCCMTLSPDPRWSKDGSSILLILSSDHKHRIDVTGESVP